jgi:putative flippase GtrA
MIVELIKFLVVGLFSNTINYMVCLILKISGYSLVMATSVGYVSGLSLSYYFGRVWVFNVRHNIRGSSLLRFLLVYAVGGMGMVSIIAFLDRVSTWNFTLIWIIGAVFAVSTNFIFSKWFTFAKGRV